MIPPRHFLVLGWMLGWLVAGRSRPLPPCTGAPPSVSVVVPARNEERRLPRLLRSLAALPPDRYEVLVVDDHSTDGTAAIADAAGARVVAAAPLPQGWTGKAHACWTGARAATSDVLVFLDADVEVSAQALDELACAARAHRGLVSAQPWHRIERPYEALSAGANVVAMMGAGTGGAGNRWWQRPTAFGPAMAIPRSTYLAAGGHAAVRGDIVEDLALAKHLARRGLPVSAHHGGPALTFRMYPEGVAGLIEGWTKNLTSGADAIAPLRTAAIAVWLTAALRAALVADPVAYAAFATQLAVLFGRAGRFRALAPVYPVPLAAFTALTAVSTGKALVGRATWRGRAVPVRGTA